ncbi:MAG: ribosome assembly cofactor RimP [Oscillospiraceae bacterium]|nr:ribosome assembly cofactor RimP [Oscillospiraceae bacterium]
MEKNKNIEEKVRVLVEPLLREAGFELWDVLFEKEGAMNYLRILFDKDSGINDEECVLMTAPINELMDEQDFIKHVDILDVGSPGLMRRLRRPEHFEQSVGKPIRLMKRGDGGKINVIYGRLTSYNRETGQITLKTDSETITSSIKNCIKINLDFE